VSGDGLGDFAAGTPLAPQVVLGHATQPALAARPTLPADWVLETVGDLNGDGAMDLATVGDVRAGSANAARDITNIDRLVRVYLSRVGDPEVYDPARAVWLRLGARDYWGAGQFTP
jgi:hypothetical protein